MYSCGPPHMDVQKQDDQYELTYSNYVRTQDVTLKTCRRRWMIGRSGERGSGISVLTARHNDDDDITGCWKVLGSTMKGMIFFIWIFLEVFRRVKDAIYDNELRTTMKEWLDHNTLFIKIYLSFYFSRKVRNSVSMREIGRRKTRTQTGWGLGGLQYLLFPKLCYDSIFRALCLCFLDERFSTRVRCGPLLSPPPP